jgi:hypothetical protein
MKIKSSWKILKISSFKMREIDFILLMKNTTNLYLFEHELSIYLIDASLLDIK